LAKCWSEWQDLNLRPPRPERDALPDCANPTLDRPSQCRSITPDCFRDEPGCDRCLARRSPQNFGIGQFVKVWSTSRVIYEVFDGSFRIAGHQWRNRFELASGDFERMVGSHWPPVLPFPPGDGDVVHGFARQRKGSRHVARARPLMPRPNALRHCRSCLAGAAILQSLSGRRRALRWPQMPARRCRATRAE
jgi:hypothetical protein